MVRANHRISVHASEGIVYVWNERVSIDLHGMPCMDVVGWLGQYFARTPGLLYGVPSSVFLDGSNEVQPDVFAGIPVSMGGRTKLTGGFVAVAPEWVAEIAASTDSIELHAKLTAYQRNGVGEYLVVLTEDQREVRWMHLVDDRFQPFAPDADGLLKSRLFPGLWLDPAALLAGDLPKLFAAIDRGCATPEHAAFVSRLKASLPALA